MEKWRAERRFELHYASSSHNDSCGLSQLKMYFRMVKIMKSAYTIGVRKVTHADCFLKTGSQKELMDLALFVSTKFKSKVNKNSITWRRIWLHLYSPFGESKVEHVRPYKIGTIRKTGGQSFS